MAVNVAETRIEIGAIAAAHGVRGAFKVKAFCDNPMALTSYGAVTLEDGRQLSIKAHSHAKGFVLCSAKEVTSRNEADSLRGALLFVERQAMPELQGDEFYHADLVGYQLVARDGDKQDGDRQDSERQDGTEIGPIIGIYDFGAGTVLEIKRHGKKAVMVPFGDSYHPDIDDEAQRLIMDIAPEWLDDTKPEKG